MTKVDDNHYYPTVDSVTLVNIRDLEYIDVSLEEFRKVSYQRLCIRAYRNGYYKLTSGKRRCNH